MDIELALLSFFAMAIGVAVLLAVGARRRRRAHAIGGRLAVQSTLDPMPPGLKHLGARLSEPLSSGLRLPAPRAAHSRLGDLIALR